MEESALDINPGCQGCIPQGTSTFLSFLAKAMTLTDNARWCLGQAPPPAPTCPPAPGCGAPPLMERNMAARPSTCPGLMEHPVERTSGA